MSELTLKIPHKAASRLALAVRWAISTAQSNEERIYLRSLQAQLETFAATLPPIYVKVTVIAIDGVPKSKGCSP
jgi:hypothetical protein